MNEFLILISGLPDFFAVLVGLVGYILAVFVSVIADGLSVVVGRLTDGLACLLDNFLIVLSEFDDLLDAGLIWIRHCFDSILINSNL